jgi:hypothetical protein
MISAKKPPIEINPITQVMHETSKCHEPSKEAGPRICQIKKKNKEAKCKPIENGPVNALQENSI